MADVYAVECADGYNRLFPGIECRYGIEYLQTLVLNRCKFKYTFQKHRLFTDLKCNDVHQLYTHKLLCITRKIKKMSYFCFSIQINFKK
jgi:hypothetical protein